MPIGISSCSLTVSATALPDATYYYVVTAIDTDGRESQYSTEYTVLIERPVVQKPKAPRWRRSTQ